MTEEDATIIDTSKAAAPVSEDEWIIHSVNIHGVFFERACRKIIDESADWIVSSHGVPVEFPPPTDHSRGKESNLDIWAVLRDRSGYDGGVHVVSLLIECKKNNPEFVKWLFFPRHREKHRRRRTHEDAIPIRDVTIWEDRGQPNGWGVQARIKRRYLENTFLVVDEARETRGSYTAHKKPENKTKTANTAITEAAYQVSLATQAIFIAESRYLAEKVKRSEMSEQFPGRDLPWARQFFLPVIVTTARLFACDFDPADIDPASGEIPFSKAAITEHPQVLYEYPLPRHLQTMPAFPEVAKDEDDLELFNRMPIWVVNSVRFGEFLKMMGREAKTLFDF